VFLRLRVVFLRLRVVFLRLRVVFLRLRVVFLRLRVVFLRTACRVPPLACRVPSPACRVPSPACRVPPPACRVPSPACRVAPPWCRVTPPVCRVKLPERPTDEPERWIVPVLVNAGVELYSSCRGLPECTLRGIINRSRREEPRPSRRWPPALVRILRARPSFFRSRLTNPLRNGRLPNFRRSLAVIVIHHGKLRRSACASPRPPAGVDFNLQPACRWSLAGVFSEGRVPSSCTVAGRRPTSTTFPFAPITHSTHRSDSPPARSTPSDGMRRGLRRCRR
jgi:hypothetical protein